MFVQWYDISYQYLIGGDGRVYEGRGWQKEGGHAYCYNDKSYGTCLIGDFTNVAPSQCMIDAYEKFLQASQGSHRFVLEVLATRTT